MVDLVVAIPTFRRPRSLARLLEALEKLETEARVTVVVADNDAVRHEGYDLCLKFRGYRWPLEAVIAPERGIAQVRNVLVERALAHRNAQFVAMLDDDEWPSTQWLDQFLRVQRETCADALQGSILFELACRHAVGPRDSTEPRRSAARAACSRCWKARAICC